MARAREGEGVRDELHGGAQGDPPPEVASTVYFSMDDDEDVLVARPTFSMSQCRRWVENWWKCRTSCQNVGIPVHGGMVHRVEFFSPAPAVFLAPAPVVGSIASAPALVLSPAVVVEYFAPSPRCPICQCQLWILLHPRQQCHKHQRQWWSFMHPRQRCPLRSRQLWSTYHPHPRVYFPFQWWSLLHPRQPCPKRRRQVWSTSLLCRPCFTQVLKDFLQDTVQQRFLEQIITLMLVFSRDDAHQRLVEVIMELFTVYAQVRVQQFEVELLAVVEVFRARESDSRIFLGDDFQKVLVVADRPLVGVDQSDSYAVCGFCWRRSTSRCIFPSLSSGPDALHHGQYVPSLPSGPRCWASRPVWNRRTVMLPV